MSKVVMIIVPVVIIGAVVGLGMSGIVNIPGLSPKKKPKVAAAMYSDKDAPPKSEKKAPPKKKVQPPKAKVKVQKITKDPALGAEALASVWNEVKVPELAKITATWKDEDLAKVLVKMDTDKVAKLLGQLAKGDPELKIPANPTRASNLSKRLQELGSLVVASG